MNLTSVELNDIRDFVWSRLDKTSTSYFEWIGENGDEGDFADRALYEAKCDMGANFYTFGCTKSCFGFKELDNYVIKIPFMGTCWNEYEDDDDDWEYPETQYAEYKNGGNLRNWDYCEVEATLYQTAARRGVADLLCGTWYLGDYYGYPIYVSEKAEREYWEDTTAYVFKHRDYSDKMAETLADASLNFFRKDILSMMIDASGFAVVSKLMHFIEDYDISDFHAGNFMYMSDGTLRLIDYSSYNC